MAKLADAPDLGSGSERSEGSSPFIRIASNVLLCSHLGISFNPRLTVSTHISIALADYVRVVSNRFTNRALMTLSYCGIIQVCRVSI